MTFSQTKKNFLSVSVFCFLPFHLHLPHLNKGIGEEKRERRKSNHLSPRIRISLLELKSFFFSSRRKIHLLLSLFLSFFLSFPKKKKKHTHLRPVVVVVVVVLVAVGAIVPGGGPVFIALAADVAANIAALPALNVEEEATATVGGG